MQVARSLLFLLTVFVSSACFSLSLDITWQFTHVIKGYDWDNRLEVFVDGSHLATSEVYKQSAKGTVSIDVPPGKHTLKLISFTCYRGEWEQCTVENDYALDAIVEKQLDLKKDAALRVQFNVARGNTRVKPRSVRRKNDQNAGTTTFFTVTWNYLNVVEGYDYENRMVVYIDGKRVLQSPPAVESKPATIAFPLASGKHDLRFQTEVLYDGKWEEQIRQFDYSIDAFYVLEHFSVSDPALLKLTFDIQTGQIHSATGQ